MNSKKKPRQLEPSLSSLQQ
nr:unnamed protein product [Digitaria exilis]